MLGFSIRYEPAALARRLPEGIVDAFPLRSGGPHVATDGNEEAWSGAQSGVNEPKTRVEALPNRWDEWRRSMGCAPSGDRRSGLGP